MSEQGRMDHQDDDGVSVEIAWPDDLPELAQAVNQFAITPGTPLMSGVPDGTLYVFFGHVLPPPSFADPSVAREWAHEGKRLSVSPRGGIVMSMQRAEELWQQLGTHLGKFN